ncbi:SDR family NAD(P)-dependent oxidoreductase [Cellulophaga baltica]|uniref:SDR family NAD(P)-dependent oxidoreductase n=1 Tax=Cellulophaga TaxID=104264 RepID=UPI001C07E9E5|nr:MULTISPECIES: SDR family NAD(P)-dependent oxidoreductase [Cellulophaga]MBU2996813.1 SDR family NAD(P)-dependent oxidoreductase [Cellulophaga baltica]MDO6768209.1 SDR family NAD(P)-dependent oxidoreductase [Cellulophaga sp. 1_MG-2023]
MNVFIAGGTSGIGYSLAMHYLSKGNRVGVCGRDIHKVSKKSSLALNIYEADVSDITSVEKVVKTFVNSSDVLDIFINCAGSYAEDVAGEISYNEASQMLRTNILGTTNCFEVARNIMIRQKKGCIAVIASVSGILDYKNSSLYTKTKRSVIQIASAYNRALKPFGISVTTIAPGYINTQKLRDLNAGDLSKKPFIVDVDIATLIIADAIDKRKKLIIFPTKMKWLMQFLSILPSSLLNLIMFRKAKWMKQK